MPKTWKPGDEKRFARELVLGRTYYTVVNIARNMAPYEDSQLYSEYVFTKRLPITGTPCTEDGGSAVTLLRQFGPIHDTPPRGMRNIADRAPQVAGPVPQDYDAELDEAEILALRSSVARGSSPRHRRSPSSWRP